MSNPLLTPSPLPFQYPPFNQIHDAHFEEALVQGMAEQAAEVETIAASDEPPTVANTLEALERSGQTLTRAALPFYNLTSAHTNDALEAIRSRLAPRLAAHRDGIMLNAALFARVQHLYDQRASLALNPEAHRLVEKVYADFVRAGASLEGEARERLKAINAELATLQTTFSQHVKHEANALALVLDGPAVLAGLDDAGIAAAAAEAKARGLDGKYVLPLQNTSVQPLLARLEDRALRERIHRTSLSRGSRGGDYDNTALVAQVMRLRAERAQLLGYANHAAYVLEDQTAGTPEAVRDLLMDLAPRAVANARREAEALQALIDAGGGGFALAPWDWPYYAERLRKARYAYDEAALRPYLELDSVLHKGVFYAAEQLYGLRFAERHDLPVYHPDVRVFDVTDHDGTPLALLLCDFYARPSKRGGAWMNAYVRQSHLLGHRPVIGNHQNITKPADGQPTLLTFTEVTTMFHEFGHALHGMLSDVRYPYFSGTAVPRDFVEYPSQLNEMWAICPEVLARYARHHETGAPMPQALLDRVLASQQFNQGYATTEYLAAALLDQAWHTLQAEEVPPADGVMAFEAEALARAGVALPQVPPRYRTPYFSHIMGGYASGYYAYIWAEVLDADTEAWFNADGGLQRRHGTRLREYILSRGGSADAQELYRTFRGRDAKVMPLLERRGLV